MNREQADRLLNVARALREAPVPENFFMGCYVWGLSAARARPVGTPACGTPACALGHYGSRTDLQSIMKIGAFGNKHLELVYTDGGGLVDYGDTELQDHFGLNDAEARALFGADGCGEALTPIEAAEYIEDFVSRGSSEQDTGEEAVKRGPGSPGE